MERLDELLWRSTKSPQLYHLSSKSPTAVTRVVISISIEDEQVVMVLLSLLLLVLPVIGTASEGQQQGVVVSRRHDLDQ